MTTKPDQGNRFPFWHSLCSSGKGMAKIFDAWEGDHPVRSRHFDERPLRELIRLLELRCAGRMAETSKEPQPFKDSPTTGAVREPVALYICVEEKEIAADLPTWKSGWYLLMASPVEAKRVLVENRLKEAALL
jgi:hypothetical protein